MSDRIKLYLDEDAQRTDLIQALRARQIDVQTVPEVNLIGESDDIQLRHATQQGRVIFTFNRGDFYQLHKDWLKLGRDHAGIIVSDQLTTGLIVRRLLRVIETKSAGEMRNWLEFLSNWGKSPSVVSFVNAMFETKPLHHKTWLEKAPMRNIFIFLLPILAVILLSACSRESRQAIATRVFTSGGTAAAEGFIVGRTVAAEAVRTGAPVARTLAAEAVTTGGPIARTVAAEGAIVGGTIGAIALSTGGPIAGTAAAGGFSALNTRLAQEPGYTCPQTVYTVDSDLSEVVDISGQQLDAAIAATVPGSPLIGLGETIARAGREKGINAYYIAGHAAWDSAWGTSAVATRKNNLFGYGVSPSCPFDCAVPYASQAESVDAVMTLVKNDYLTPGGRFYNGGNLAGMAPIYAPGNPDWAGGIAAIMNLLRQNTPCPQ